MIALLATLCARAETLVLEVSPAAMPYGPAVPSDTLWLGAFSLATGQPRLGRIEPGEGGAHLVVPMVARARILADGPGASRRHPAASLARAATPSAIAPTRITVVPTVHAEISVRVEPVRFDGRVGLQTGARSTWVGPGAGRELGRYETELGRVTGSLAEIPHEVGFWVPSEAWGPQSVRMVYTIAAW